MKRRKYLVCKVYLCPSCNAANLGRIRYFGQLSFLCYSCNFIGPWHNRSCLEVFPSEAFDKPSRYVVGFIGFIKQFFLSLFQSGSGEKTVK